MVGFLAIIIWLLIIDVAGLFAWPIIFGLLPAFRDRGFLLSKVLGMLLLGLGTFWLASFSFLLPFRFFTVLLVLVLLGLVGGFLYFKQQAEMKKFWKQNKPMILRAETIFLGAFLIFLLIRSFNPEILWGEKPMDFTILNSILRAEHMPPHEAWFAGTNLNYYYLGSFLLAVIAKLGQIAPGVAYNLGIATVMTLFFTSTYSLILAASKRVWAAVLGALAVCVIGNLNFYTLLFNGMALDFHLFWATSRVVPNTVNEYPLWTFLFGDLHAHFVAFPFVMLTLALLYQVLEFFKEKGKIISILLLCVVLGIALGALFPINFWNWPSAAFLIVLLMGFIGLTVKAKFRKRVFLFILGLLISIFTLALSYAVWYPFHMNFHSNMPGYGLEIYGMQNLAQVLGLWGIFMIPLIILLVRDFWQKVLKKFSLFSILGVLMLALPIGFVIANSFISIYPPFRNPASSLVLILLFATTLSFILSIIKKEKPALVFAKAILSLTLLLLLLVQFYFFADKMNTIFKSYIQIGIMLPLGTSIWFFSYFFDEKGVRLGKLFKIIFSAIVCLLALAGFGAALVLITINSSSTHVPVDIKKLERPKLDGMAYLEKVNPDEYEAIKWLNKNVKGAPVILEAQKISYADFTRISMNTGLPTLLGWDYHVNQRGIERPLIDERRKDIETIYNTKDQELRKTLLKRYNVAYIFIGKLERDTYLEMDVKQLEKLGDVVFEKGKEEIIKVKF